MKKAIFLNWIVQPSDDLRRLERLKKEKKLCNLVLIKGHVVDVSHVIKDSSLVLSTDSGWLHVSSFYNVPTIGLFGFDTMSTWLPPGMKYITSKKVYPDYYRYKKKYQTLQPLALIDVEEIVEAIQQLQD